MYTERDSIIGFWLPLHPILFNPAPSLLVNRGLQGRWPKGLMKIMGVSFAKIPILESCSVYFFSDFETPSKGILEKLEQEAISKYGKKETKSKCLQFRDRFIRLQIFIVPLNCKSESFF